MVKSSLGLGGYNTAVVVEGPTIERKADPPILSS